MHVPHACSHVEGGLGVAVLAVRVRDAQEDFDGGRVVAATTDVVRDWKPLSENGRKSECVRARRCLLHALGTHDYKH